MVDENNSLPGPDGEAAEERPDQDKKRRGGRGPLLALAVFALAMLGLYLSWPALQQSLLARLPQPASQAMEAVRALDRRMVQLEAANAQYDDAMAAMKKLTAEVSKQVYGLATSMPGGEVLGNLGEKLAALEETIAQLWQRMKQDSEAAAQTGTNNGDGAGALAMFNRQLAAVKARLNELAAGGSGSDSAAAGLAALTVENEQLRQTVAALRERLAKLEQSVRQSMRARRSGGTADGLILAAGQLRQTVLAGRPYEAPLTALAALADRDEALLPAISALKPFAKGGVVTRRALSDQFSALTRAVLRADQKDGGGFLQRIWQRISSLVTVRRVGEVAGGETDAILARTERRLAADELAAAIELMDGLDGPAAAAARSWLDRAKARLGAEAALEAIQAQIIAAMAGG
jgi:hypothetical protein